MRLPRFKLSVGTLLVAIAAFGLGIYSERAHKRFAMLMGRADACRAWADSRRLDVKVFGQMLEKHKSTNTRPRMIEGLSQVVEIAEEDADRHERLRRRYVLAAWLPFLSLPDELENYNPPPVSSTPFKLGTPAPSVP